MQNEKFTFSKSEKLTGKIRIDKLYKEGKSFVAFPFFIVYMPEEGDADNRLLISVPKRNFKNATDRNLLRRRIREAYRLHKSDIAAQHLNIAFNYIAKHKMEYAKIEQKLVLAIDKLNEKLT